ncbi:hypothetical protein OHA77_39805 [Streptosporangium sp. NBC_01639]|uniref:hypothetical protein n=1 Tax=Streptosporangium sp. NBC_01639 TaxID=2975948 RepID=UPI00386AB98F|nr:hypothetical protein OHA77_39805 [Streptosporangium sp. NBC_01639]
MPKRQPTAAKRARTLARQGAKYTTALREESAGHPATPGPGPDGKIPPCPDLPYEIKVFVDFGCDDSRVHSPGYLGRVPDWWTKAWTHSAERAAEIARALVAWHEGDRVATVWGPGEDGRRLVLRVEAGPAPRPEQPYPVFGALPPGVRPASPAPIPRPALAPGVEDRDAPGFCLRVWTTAGPRLLRPVRARPAPGRVSEPREPKGPILRRDARTTLALLLPRSTDPDNPQT